MKTLGKILLGILDGIAKALAFVLVSLGLWFPALFTVAFFIGCGATHTSLGGGIMTFYFIGLGITAVCGFTLAMYLRVRKKRKLAGGDSVSAVKTSKKKDKVAAQEQPQCVQPNPYAQNYYAYPPPPPSQPYPPYYPPPPQNYAPTPQQNYAPPPPQNYTPPRQNTASQQSDGGYDDKRSYNGAPRDNRDLDRKYFSETPAYYERTASFSESDFPQDYGRTMSKSEQREADSKFDSEELWRRLSGADVPDEKPLVFRTRKDPDLYVYEYSDRYQYWRRTGAGMVFESTEWKKKETKRM